MNSPSLGGHISPHRTRRTKGRYLITNKEMSKHLTGRVVITKTRRAMEEIKGTSIKLRLGMLVLPRATWKITDSVRMAIVRVSEGATKIRDKLPLVDTTRMNDPPNALNTEVVSHLHMDVLKPRNGAAPTNSKALAASGAIESTVHIGNTGKRVKAIDLLTNPSDEGTTVIATKRNAYKVMGLTPDLVTSIVVTLGKVRTTSATGVSTRAAMNTERVTTTANARTVMGSVNTVADTRGPHISTDMRVLRVATIEKGRRCMGGMKALITPLVSKGTTCTAEITTTHADEDTTGLHIDTDTKVLMTKAMLEKGHGPMGTMKAARTLLVSKGSMYKAVMKITQIDEDIGVIDNADSTSTRRAEAE